MLKKILHTRVSNVAIHTWLLLLLICLAGYWPVSSNLFSLKNDAYIYFLPCRFFISECIQQGQLPLWNPYFYMGFPLHGDIQGGVWNPIVLIISCFTTYNMTVLQYETLLYIFIAGIGMYKLLDTFKISHYSKLALAVCYMFSGFIVDTGQITVWTGSAAFIPFLFLYYFRLLFSAENQTINALKTALALYFLLTAGYPSFLIMGGYLMLAGLIAVCFTRYKKKELTKNNLGRLLMANILLFIFFILIALPALLSYIDYFPYYQRSSGTSLAEAQINPFNPFAIISYIFPLSVTKQHSFLTTDPTARSAYVGIFTLLMLATIFRNKLNRFHFFIIGITTFTFFFSIGDALPVRQFCYHYLPMMNLFRHPANMRLFTTIGIIVLAAFGMDRFFHSLKEKKKQLLNIYTAIFLLVIAGLMLIFSSSGNLPGKLIVIKDSFSGAANKRVFIKQVYDSLNFADAIILEGFLQMLFLLVFMYLIKKRQAAAIVFLIILNALLTAQFSIPNTFVSKVSPAKINALIKESPEGYPIPNLNNSIAKNSLKEASTKREFGCAAFYRKELVQVSEELNPSFTNSLKEFDENKGISSTVLQYPVCYFADTIALYKDSLVKFSYNKKVLFVLKNEDSLLHKNQNIGESEITIKQFSPLGISLETNTNKAMPIVLFQNYNSNWKLLIDGKATEIKKGNISFMFADVEQGKHLLEWKYKPGYIFYSIIISIITFLIIIFLLIKNKKTTPLSPSLH